MVMKIHPKVLTGVLCCLPVLEGSAQTARSETLQKLATDVWERQLQENPLLRLRKGLRVTNLPEISFQRAQENADFARSVLDRLKAVDSTRLGEDEAITRDILEWQSTMEVEGLRYFWLRSLLTPYRSPLPGLRRIFGALPLDSQEDAAAYLRLLEQVRGFVEAIETNARGQLERGYVLSRANLPAAIELVRVHIQPPDKGPFAVPEERLAYLGPEQTVTFRARLSEIVHQQINPALERLLQYLDGDYRARAPEGVGVAQYPDGKEYYRHLTRFHTTLDVTPERVQQTGFRLVSEIQERMDEIRREVGFEGSRAEFHKYLQSEPRYFPRSPEEVAERLKAASDAFFARISSFFLRSPQAPYAVRRLSPALEGSQTYGYYDAPTAAEPTGYYNYNGSRLDERSWLNFQALSFHELIPGHHFQIARQFENEELPELRRHTMQTAFTEGWGSYAAYLGLEAGLYSDPYSRYGLYVMEVFLATRLVVDPGMNFFDWPLERARQYMRDNTLESETQIATESLRYSTDMPGQALGYQMGKAKLLELRQKAERALGVRFDIRRFHEAVIGSGSMPLAVLEKHIDRFIREELRR
jgi:uncharacterized protein (DUF885 family)